MRRCGSFTKSTRSYFKETFQRSTQKAEGNCTTWSRCYDDILVEPIRRIINHYDHNTVPLFSAASASFKIGNIKQEQNVERCEHILQISECTATQFTSITGYDLPHSGVSYGKLKYSKLRKFRLQGWDWASPIAASDQFKNLPIIISNYTSICNQQHGMVIQRCAEKPDATIVKERTPLTPIKLWMEWIIVTTLHLTRQYVI
jgi:hypothetical protein